MTDARERLLSEVGADLRATLERVPAHYFQTATAIAASDDREGVLEALVGLLQANTAQLARQIAADEAELATFRRHGLRLVPHTQTTKETP